jgi:hypothetical protein
MIRCLSSVAALCMDISVDRQSKTSDEYFIEV